VEERIVSSSREFLKGGAAYRQSVHLHARLLDRAAAADPDFKVRVEVSPARILEGEEVTIHIHSTRDARIYLLALYPGGGELLLPNEKRPNAIAEAHRSVSFPSDSDKQRGIRLIARLPAGLSHSVESLLILAMRGDLDHPGLSELMSMGTAPEEAGLLISRFLVPLIDLPPDDWTLDQTLYEVFAR
jgi:hypothetical protein